MQHHILYIHSTFISFEFCSYLFENSCSVFDFRFSTVLLFCIVFWFSLALLYEDAIRCLFYSWICLAWVSPPCLKYCIFKQKNSTNFVSVENPKVSKYNWSQIEVHFIQQSSSNSESLHQVFASRKQVTVIICGMFGEIEFVMIWFNVIWNNAS